MSAAPSTAAVIATPSRLPPGPKCGGADSVSCVHDAHVVHLDAEVVGEHLRDHRVLPLPFEREADPDDDLAVEIDADRRAFGHAGAGLADDGVGVPVEDAGLDRVDQADAEIAALRRAPPSARARSAR